MGWITVAAYAVAVLLCYLCQRQSPPGLARRFWWGLALLMLALGINKQLDLQTWLTEVGRDLALQQGWYPHRRVVQAVFIAAIGGCGLGVGVWLARRLRDLDTFARRAGYGLVVLGVFVMVRAASFHHVDMLLGFSWNSIAVNAVLELGGIGAIVHSAWGRWRSLHPKP